MIWPFKKRYPSKHAIQLEDRWSVGTGGTEEKPLLVRFNTAARKIAGHPQFRHQAGVAVPFHEPSQSGMPTHAEAVQLSVIEDRLSKLLCGDNQSLLVGVITTGGMREFVLYTSDPEGLKERFHALQHAVGSHELQLMIQLDPRWSCYEGFVASL